MRCGDDKLEQCNAVTAICVLHVTSRADVPVCCFEPVGLSEFLQNGAVLCEIPRLHRVLLRLALPSSSNFTCYSLLCSSLLFDVEIKAVFANKVESMDKNTLRTNPTGHAILPG